MTESLKPGSIIGIFGGGQLGRMLALAAARLGFLTHIYDPDEAPPAGQVAYKTTQASFSDISAIKKFAQSVDVVTFEFENIPASAIDAAETICPVHPGGAALAASQDRVLEKDFLNGLGLKTAPYLAVDTEADLEAALQQIGTPAILKTRRFGYDGKGQIRITGAENLATLMASLEGAPAILEGFVDFSAEISVIGARAIDGQVVCFDPGENVHKAGILHTTTVPADLSFQQRTDAVILAGHVLNALNYVGVLAVELFVTPAGLVVNEFAPRVHNSGHWTQNGCATDQFEQHIRAIAGWPLGDGQRLADVVMTNLIGDEISQFSNHAADPENCLHHYGKAAIRAGRKMGHINKVSAKSSA
ncbi:MAG: 5-(carboxyamino)imidazole ribonucleotide synthase [Alphaproteobacteria bacterium]|nr:5-(carboxyamino)imidazole ribonucleotide synthase [Alphaproteobacteria bacterium]